MTAVSIGFFAVPARHLDEVTRLYEQWGESLYDLQDDFLVRYNELYRRAAAVALHHAELSGEKSLHKALAALGGFICDKVWQGKDQGLFAPDEARTLARAMAALERRARSRSRLVLRIARHDGEREASDTCRRVYEAFREALDVAVSQGAGFLWAAFWPGAEAELAERRAREEQRLRELAASEAEWQRLSPEEREAREARHEEDRARAQAELDALVEERLLKRLDSERAEEEELGEVWLCLFPGEDAGALRGLLRAGYERYEADAYDESDRLFGQVRAHLEARAIEVVVLRKYGAYRALVALDRRLRADAPAVHDPAGVYAPAQARAVLDALGEWEAGRGGETGVVDDLAGETWMPEPLIAAAYRACKRALAQAGARPCALLWLLDDRHDVLEGLPATGGGSPGA